MIDPNNIQRFIVSRYPHSYRVVLLFKYDNQYKAKQFIKRWLDKAEFGQTEDGSLETKMHFGFSWSGLSKLLENSEDLNIDDGRAAMGTHFTNPINAPDSRALSEELGFLGDQASDNWWSGLFSSQSVDMAIYCYFSSEGEKKRMLGDIRGSAEHFGIQELELPEFEDKALSGTVPSDGVLHFGYRDGITSPEIDWLDEGKEGTTDFREFFVGYPNKDYPTPPFEHGPWQDFARDGSFMGLTWIYQNVAEYNKCLNENAQLAAGYTTPGGEVDWLAAKLMGRWRDGSPLSKHPYTMPDTPDLSNDFDYSDDEVGLRCPLHAHIRVANIRAQELSSTNRSRFPNGPPKLIRKGFSYGPKLEGLDDDGVDRGLIGSFICASLSEQFNTALRWAQRTEFSDDFNQIENGRKSQDGLLGNRGKPGNSKKMQIPVSADKSLELSLSRFIEFKGIVSLFAPSRIALHRLVSLN